jgi:hypothetical protein
MVMADIISAHGKIGKSPVLYWQRWLGASAMGGMLLPGRPAAGMASDLLQHRLPLCRLEAPTFGYLAYEEWSGRDLQTLSAWVEDTLERFRFVLEPNQAGLSDGDQARLEVLAPRIDPVDGQVAWLEGKPDLKRLAVELNRLAGRTGPVYLISRDHDLDAMNQVKTMLEIMGG